MKIIDRALSRCDGIGSVAPAGNYAIVADVHMSLSATIEPDNAAGLEN